MAPPPKRRRPNQPEEISFDFDARSEYLTGFHKRKLHRIKVAQQENAKKERDGRIETRKNMRELRKQELENHVETVNKLLRRANGDETEDESGENDSGDDKAPAGTSMIDPGREEEYIDEDRYTTVTVEPMKLSDDEDTQSEGSAGANTKNEALKNQTETSAGKKRVWTRKKPDDGKGNRKKKKFKYESPVERKLARSKAKTRNSAAAKARRG